MNATIRLICGFGAMLAFAAHAAPTARFAISAEGSLTLDARAQQSGDVSLKAILSPAYFGVDTAQTLADSRFTLTAALSSSSLVCYADTIFRDDFDGDGL